MARFLGPIAALAFTLAAAVHFIEELRARPLIGFAASIERSAGELPINADVKARLLAEIEQQHGCRHLLARSRVTASLFILRQDTRNGTSADSGMALQEAKRVTQDALACNPLDGNLWFLAGWLGFQIAPNAGLLHEFLLTSIRLSPLEGAVLDTRWRAIAPVIAELGLARDPAVMMDLDHLFQFSKPEVVAEVYTSLHTNGSADVAGTAMSHLSAGRQETIRQSLHPSNDLPYEPKRPTLPLSPFRVQH